MLNRVLSKTSIKEYQRILIRRGFNVTEEEAEQGAERLLMIYRAVFITNPQNQNDNGPTFTKTEKTTEEDSPDTGFVGMASED